MIVTLSITEPVTNRTWNEFFIRCGCGAESTPRRSRSMAIVSAADEGYATIDEQYALCPGCVKEAA